MKRRRLWSALQVPVAALLIIVVSGLVAPGTARAQEEQKAYVYYQSWANVSPTNRCGYTTRTEPVYVEDDDFFSRLWQSSPCNGLMVMVMLTYRDADPAAGTPTRVAVTATTLLVRVADNAVCTYDRIRFVLVDFRWEPTRNYLPTFTLDGCGQTVEMRATVWRP